MNQLISQLVNQFINQSTRLLEKVYNLEEAVPGERDPYSDDNTAPFYRQPAGLRRARKHEVKEELGRWRHLKL